MALTFIQIVGNDGFATTSQSAAFASNVTEGDLLVVACQWENSGTQGHIQSLTDTLGNVYIPCAGGITQTGTSLPTNLNNVFYWTVSQKSGANTVTMKMTETVSVPVIIAAEYRGANHFDVGNGTVNVTSTTPTSGPISTTFPIELLVATTFPSAGTFQAPTGWTQRIKTPNSASMWADQFETAKGTYSAVFGDFSGDDPVVIAGFYQARLPTDAIFFGMT
jgi:hypothetical protein